MKTPVAYCKILKSQKWAKVKLADIQEVNSDNRLSPFDEATYKKANKYVIKDTENKKFLVICVVEFADSIPELDKKLIDEDGIPKRFAASKRLSQGPTELKVSDYEPDEINATKQERAVISGIRKKKETEESNNILQTISSKTNSKKKEALKKKTELNVGETKKATLADDEKILKAASKSKSPEKRTMLMKGGPSPKKNRTKGDRSEEEEDEDSEEENGRKMLENKLRQIKLQQEKEQKEEDEKQRKADEERQRKAEEEMQQKADEEGKRKQQKQRKAEEDWSEGSVLDEEFDSCENALCASQLKMALLTIQRDDKRYNALLETVNSIKKELRELKDAISSGGTPQVDRTKKETCKLRHLKDVNPETDLEYSVPDGMVHIGGGKLIELVKVAQLEKVDDLRGRLTGLCKLYWPGNELNEWSLSGKKGDRRVNKITNDYTAGMTEILSAMHWRKKANLSHANVHRTLSRVISELLHSKEERKEKKKGRDNDQSDEDEEDDEDKLKGGDGNNSANNSGSE